MQSSSEAPVSGSVDGAPLVLAGGGLANALIAVRLAALPKPPRMLMLEAGPAILGQHTWSFHDADVTKADRKWLDPLVAHRWRAQAVRFENEARLLETGYQSVTSASLKAALEAIPSLTIRAGARIEAIDADGATLVGGERIRAGCIVDARGHREHEAMELGFQKFVGLEVETREPHGIDNPVIMDATVEQLDGYRFVYLLPISPTRILIEDTRYSDGGALDHARIRADILAYAEKRGWHIGNRIEREEHGVLPIALRFDAEAFWKSAPRDVPQAGMRAALFHPTTGYSLPEAVRLANLVGKAWPCASADLAGKIREHAIGRARSQRFARLLSRMLFKAAEPHERHRVLERFYRLPRPLIERFYAGRTTWADMARILIGRPPVPIARALAVLEEKRKPWIEE